MGDENYKINRVELGWDEARAYMKYGTGEICSLGLEYGFAQLEHAWRTHQRPLANV